MFNKVADELNKHFPSQRVPKMGKYCRSKWSNVYIHSFSGYRHQLEYLNTDWHCIKRSGVNTLLSVRSEWHRDFTMMLSMGHMSMNTLELHGRVSVK